MFQQDKCDLSQAEKKEANRIARDKVDALVREVGFDKVLYAVIRKADAQAHATELDLMEAAYGFPRASDQALAMRTEVADAARALAKALYKAGNVYEGKQGYTLDGYALARHHGKDCE